MEDLTRRPCSITKRQYSLLERYGWDREEVQSDDHLAVVVKEGQPTLAGIATTMHTLEIARDCSLGDLKAELLQLTMDLRRSPTGVLLGKPTDQIADFRRNLWSTRAPTRAPAPIPAKACSMPGDHGVGLDDEKYGFPARPEATERDPEQQVARIQNGPRLFSFEDGDLLPERDDFQRDGGAGAKEDGDGREERKEEIEQLPL